MPVSGPNQQPPEPQENQALRVETKRVEGETQSQVEKLLEVPVIQPLAKPDGKKRKGGTSSWAASRSRRLRYAFIRTVTAEDCERIARRLVRQAIKGDIQAAHEVLNRTMGKAAQPVDVQVTVDEESVQEQRARLAEWLAAWRGALLEEVQRTPQISEQPAAQLPGSPVEPPPIQPIPLAGPQPAAPAPGQANSAQKEPPVVS